MYPKLQANKSTPAILVAIAGCLSLLACTVSVRDHGGNDSGKVDIETPIGGIHVNEQADVHDTGFPLYPGARQKQNTDHDSKSANVNISSGYFGLKVVAIEYETEDPPNKVLAFYRDQMKKFGAVVECRTNKRGSDLTAKAGASQNGSKAVSCDDDNGGNVVELKSGTEDNEHLVSIEPAGKGSDFALVYVRTRGKQGEI